MTISEIEHEFDKIALTHPPPDLENYDWRIDGITGNMTLEFCKTKTDLQLIIYHKGKKIMEYLSDEKNRKKFQL